VPPERAAIFLEVAMAKKSVSTDLTKENVERVLEMLDGAGARLERYRKSHTGGQLTKPLGSGQRSPVQVLAHILNCEARTSETIYLALLQKEPQVVVVHPERDWGKLMHYDDLPFAELVAYFKFRRAVLMRVLRELPQAKWSRAVRWPGKQRLESVYWQARGLAMHEEEHLVELGA
jgi:hypothetical protein